MTTFKGSYTVTITPFTEDGSAIDIPAWKRFLDWQLGVGVPGIIIMGTTGEFLRVFGLSSVEDLPDVERP